MERLNRGTFKKYNQKLNKASEFSKHSGGVEICEVKIGCTGPYAPSPSPTSRKVLGLLLEFVRGTGCSGCTGPSLGGRRLHTTTSHILAAQKQQPHTGWTQPLATYWMTQPLLRTRSHILDVHNHYPHTTGWVLAASRNVSKSDRLQ